MSSRPAIFHRSLLRELTVTALAVFSVLLTISLSTAVVRFLGQAASGQVTSDAVKALIGFNVLQYLPVLLSLTLFISVLMTLTRSYRDSEMVVWFSSGLSITAWVRPVLAFAMPVVLAIFVLSLFITPWGVRKASEFRSQLNSRDEVSAVAPGVFKESRQADRVYFVESFAGENNTVSNIFVQSSQHERVGVMVARNGYVDVAPNGDRYLVMLKGRRYEGVPGTAEYKIVQFERYGVRIQPYEAKFDAPTPKGMTLTDLLSDPKPVLKAELQWRLSLPIAALVLALLAIPLSFVNPRAGRSLNLMLAVIVYTLYSNLLGIAQAWLAQGKLQPSIGLWAVHAGMVVILLLLFWRRLSLSPLMMFRRQK